MGRQLWHDRREITGAGPTAKHALRVTGVNSTANLPAEGVALKEIYRNPRRQDSVKQLFSSTRFLVWAWLFLQQCIGDQNFIKIFRWDSITLLIFGLWLIPKGVTASNKSCLCFESGFIQNASLLPVTSYLIIHPRLHIQNSNFELEKNMNILAGAFYTNHLESVANQPVRLLFVRFHPQSGPGFF